GHVAKLIGIPSYSRRVGQGTMPPFGFPSGHSTDRVLSSAGRLSPRGPGTDGAARQSEALQAEDADVRAGRTNELLVDLATYGWFPAPGTISSTAP
ncbi:hypothetical protein BJY52DRAFT_1122763, partial [Lactarius psammicola]